MQESKYTGPVAGVVIFLLGATLGGILALLFGTDDKGETRPLVKKRIRNSKEKLAAGAEWAGEKAADLAEAVPEKFKKTYAEAKRVIAQKIETAKAALQKVDREKYADFVGEVVEHMKQAGGVAGAEVTRLKTYLMEDYALMTTEASAKIKRSGSKRSPKK